MRISDLDLIFVPDSPGEGADHWQTRWRTKLSTAIGVTPDERGPTAADVVATAAKARQPILFIGHSRGAHAIADAAKHLVDADVRGAFLVAPPDDEAMLAVHGARPETFSRAKLPWRSLVVASRTDPLAPFDRSEALAADWGAELVDAGDSGRIDADSGHGPWPDGLLRLAKFLKSL